MTLDVGLPGAAMLDVNERFGPTVQGEGASLGRLCVFVRLARCNLDCGEGPGASWCCFAPDTPVLMADWTSKPIQDVRPGDLVMAYGKRSYTVTRVSDTSRHVAERRVTVHVDGRSITCTPDHEWYVQHSRDPRHGMTAKAEEMAGRPARWSKLGPWRPDAERRTEGWHRGYLMGAVLGDGHVRLAERRSTYTGQLIKPRTTVRVQVVDREFAAMCCEAARVTAGRNVAVGKLAPTRSGRPTYGFSTTVGESLAFILDTPGDKDEARGFVAGMFDAEGSISGRCSQLEISQQDPKPLRRVVEILRSFGFDPTLNERAGQNRVMVNGLENVDRFMDVFRPAISRKREAHREQLGRLLGSQVVDEVTEAEPGVVYNLTTTTGNYFADRFLVANCDTPYTWRWDGRFDDRRPTFDSAAEIHPTPISELTMWVMAKRVPLCVISGGEPLAQRAGVAQLARELANQGVATEVETNGTIAPGPAADPVTAFNVSPKLANSGVDEQRRYRPGVLERLVATGKARFKFVCATEADLDEVQAIVDDVPLPAASVWIMPAGTSADAIAARLRLLAEPTIAHGWNLTTRLHVECWGDTRGV